MAHPPALVLLPAALLSAVLPWAGALGGDSFDPADADIPTLRLALDSHRTSSEQLVRYYLDRIERLDKRGLEINALITLNPDALEEARKLDRDAGGRPPKSMLYGIPFIVKDNYDTAGIATSGGSAALGHSIPVRNAFVVQKLLDRGAILIGKANMSELAASYGRMGYSSAGGLTLNPRNTARDASGSSSGSAAAVAADFAPFALGTDTSGSIRGPAGVCGLIGLRPTFGLTSRTGVIPLSLTFDTTGALTRTVADQAIVLDAIAGPDPQDAATSERTAPPGEYLPLNERRSLRGARFGVITNFRGANPDVDGAERSILMRMRAQGAVLVPIDLPKEFENLWDLVLGPAGEAEFKNQFERYLRTLPAGGPKTLAELIEVSASPAVQGSATPVNPERLEALRKADATSLTDSPAYIRILTTIIPSIRRTLDTLFAANRLDAMVFPTLACPASPRYDRPDPSYICRTPDPYRASYIAAVAGFPEVTVPSGSISAHVPIGYSFMGLADREKALLELAGAFLRAR